MRLCLGGGGGDRVVEVLDDGCDGRLGGGGRSRPGLDPAAPQGLPEHPQPLPDNGVQLGLVALSALVAPSWRKGGRSRGGGWRKFVRKML